MKLSKNLQILFIALAIIPSSKAQLGTNIQYLTWCSILEVFFFGIIIILILINTHAFSFITRNTKIYLTISLIFIFSLPLL